jgi:amino acid permease
MIQELVSTLVLIFTILMAPFVATKAVATTSLLNAIVIIVLFVGIGLGQFVIVHWRKANQSEWRKVR